MVLILDNIVAECSGMSKWNIDFMDNIFMGIGEIGEARVWRSLHEGVRRQEEIKLKKKSQSPHCGSVETNLTSNHEDAGFIPGLAQWVKDPALLWVVV